MGGSNFEESYDFDELAFALTKKRGGGGDHVYHYDEYAYGERPSAAYGWVQKIVSDATAPTS